MDRIESLNRNSGRSPLAHFGHYSPAAARGVADDGGAPGRIQAYPVRVFWGKPRPGRAEAEVRTGLAARRGEASASAASSDLMLEARSRREETSRNCRKNRSDDG